MKTNPDLVNFAREVGSELSRLTSPPDSRHTAPPQYTEAGGRGGFPFLEHPTANYAGSQTVSFEVPQTNFIPIPDDLREMVEAEMRGSSGAPEHPKSPRPVQQNTNLPATTLQSVPPSTSVGIPDGFDFDLFQFAVLKDLSVNMAKAVDGLKQCIDTLEKHRGVIDKAIKNNPLGRTGSQ